VASQAGSVWVLHMVVEGGLVKVGIGRRKSGI